MRMRVLTAGLASAIAGLLTGCAIIDHFRYPTGKTDVRDYQRAMAETEVGMLRAEFEALWAGDEEGYRILAVETERAEDRVVRRYTIGFTIEYMEASGRDIDSERRDVLVPRTPAEQDSVHDRAPEPSYDFWTRVRVTDVVTCVDDWVTSVSRPDRSKTTE